jgi:Tfp pilus assembly protein PilO
MPVNFSKSLGMEQGSQVKALRNTLFEVGLLLLICGLFYWFIILPKQAEINQKQSAYNEVSTQETGISGKVAALNSLLKTLHSNTEKTVQLDEAIPLSGDVIEPRLLIKKLADSANVTVGSIGISGSPGAVAAGNTDLLSRPYDATRTLHTLTASVYVLGSFDQLQSFLQKIEQSGRLMNVSGVAIAQDSQGVLNMRLAMDMYYLAP